MNYKKIGVVVLLISIALNIYLWNRDTEEVIIPSQSGTVTVVAPEPIVLYDTLKIKGKTEYIARENPINKELLSKYNNALDTIEKIKLFKAAVTERKYFETFSDSVQKITVESDVIGTLTRQKISYITNPKKISVLKRSNRLELFLGVNASLPIEQPLNIAENVSPSLGANLMILTNKNTLTVGINTNKTFLIGVGFKLFNK